MGFQEYNNYLQLIAKDKRLTKGDSSVLIYLFSIRNHQTGLAWRRRSELSKELDILPVNISRSLKQLGILGYIHKITFIDPHTRKSRNQYQLPLLPNSEELLGTKSDTQSEQLLVTKPGKQSEGSLGIRRDTQKDLIRYQERYPKGIRRDTQKESNQIPNDNIYTNEHTMFNTTTSRVKNNSKVSKEIPKPKVSVASVGKKIAFGSWRLSNGLRDEMCKTCDVSSRAIDKALEDFLAYWEDNHTGAADWEDKFRRHCLGREEWPERELTDEEVVKNCEEKVRKHISSLSEDVRSMGMLIRHVIGVSSYASWLLQCKFMRRGSEVVIIADRDFARRYIEEKFERSIVSALAAHKLTFMGIILPGAQWPAPRSENGADLSSLLSGLVTGFRPDHVI